MKTSIYLYVVIFALSITGLLQAQWLQTNGIYGGEVRSLAINGDNIFSGTTENGAFLSTNNGLTWTPVNNGLPANAQLLTM